MSKQRTLLCRPAAIYHLAVTVALTMASKQCLELPVVGIYAEVFGAVAYTQYRAEIMAAFLLLKVLIMKRFIFSRIPAVYCQR